ncbi:23S rRNA (adenine(2503)-C(2))-methyltransferase RlmN [Desulfococcaceae bacterium HSG8]|nr:23S rRNA (adenine(2503)-C(2))-methyltransferase RlmN [Desulfococcaceae bacterium HSG8]
MDIKELTREQLIAWLGERDIASYRAEQILKWIYLRQADTFDVMTDLGKEVRELLSSCFTISCLETVRIQTSQDGSRKYLFKLDDGEHIESVLIPEKDHYTLCISSQVGCAQGCRFCLTARDGFRRNLTRGEIISQVRDIRNELEDSGWLTNIVFMGMGEPLANYKNVINAIAVITNNDFGLRFSNRKVTVSTAGMIPRLSDLGSDTKVSLAVSLNASDNRTRNKLMPVNRKYPLDKLLEACRNYRLPPGRMITFEYILIKGINDSQRDAERLVKLLRPVKSKVNLIPFNEHEESDFRRPETPVIYKFQEILSKNNYTVIIRRSKGEDISAACGQLRANVMRDA